MSSINMRTVRATKYVTPFREGGSLPGLVEADDDGLYVVKFRGAAQGPKALVAEVIAGELARAVGLPVPELVLVDIDPSLGGLDGDPWVGELLEKSPGINLGVDFLPGSLTFNARADGRPDPSFAADVVWFDALVTNTDRSPRNPNLLAWHRRLFLIDHGAALFIHHAWREPEDHARRPLQTMADHVLLPYAGALADAHARLAPLATEGLLADIAGLVPETWLSTPTTIGGPDAQREAYVRYLQARIAAREPLVDAIEEVRRAATRAA